MSAPTLRWVPIKRYCEMTGETEGAVRNRLRAGHWLKDVHARNPHGSKHLWINLDAVNDWAEGKVPGHLHGTGRATLPR